MIAILIQEIEILYEFLDCDKVQFGPVWKYEPIAGIQFLSHPHKVLLKDDGNSLKWIEIEKLTLLLLE